MQLKAPIFMRFLVPLFLIAIFLFSSCNEDDNEALQREPIEVNKPDSLIVKFPSNTTIPLEIELFLPANVDSLAGKYRVGRTQFIPLFTKSYSGTSNNEVYEGEFEIPDSLNNGTKIRCLFTAFDVNDSTYMKTLRIDIQNE